MGSMKKAGFEEQGILEISPRGRFIKYNDVLSRSAFSVVYKGFDQDHGVEIAWNQIFLEPPIGKEILLSKACLLKSLKHENVIRCYSSWIDEKNNSFNVITELFNSGTLRQFKKKHKHVDIKAIRNWAEQILKGLSFLHSRNPPIIHKNLSCSTIFVNGNHGEVKIGDLGLSIGISSQVSDDEEMNKLVDLHSFGNCMLELVTSECPQSECKNQDLGMIPLSLIKVKDPQIKEFIEKCLKPQFDHQLSAEELLKDPFFTSETEKRPNNAVLQQVTASEVETKTRKNVESSANNKSDNNMKIRGDMPSAFTSELWRFKDVMQFRLRGERVDVNTIDLNLCISDSKEANNYSFAFDIRSDDALSVVVELVKGHDLSYRYLPQAVEIIDSMLLGFEPDWTPTY